MFGAPVQAAPAKPAHNPNADLEVPVPADMDSASSLTFSPASDFFCVTSWNNNAYIWQYNAQGQTFAKAQNSGTQPVLCNAWKHDGSGIFLGGCDKTVRLWDLASNQAMQVAAHDAPVRQASQYWASGPPLPAAPTSPALQYTPTHHRTAL
jgi:mRNA export factor